MSLNEAYESDTAWLHSDMRVDACMRQAGPGMDRYFSSPSTHIDASRTRTGTGYTDHVDYHAADISRLSRYVILTEAASVPDM